MIRILLLNSGSNVLVMIVKLIITFIMTPIFISNLGKYDYGLWEMIMSVIGYMGMLDLGLRPAISRYAAKYAAVDDRKNLMVVYSSTLIFMTAIGSLLCLFFLAWGTWFGASLAPSGESGQRYTLLLLMIGAQLLFVFPGYTAESYLEGFQKYYLKNNITIFNSIVSAIILYIFITPENGLLLLAGCNAVGMSIKYLLFIWILSGEKFGSIRGRLDLFSLVKLKEMLVFSFKSFVQGISGRIENGTDALVIGAFLGPAMVPLYSVPANLVFYIRTFGWNLTHAFMPLFSGLDARQESDQIKNVYLISSKYMVALISALAVGVCIVGGPFIVLWIGPDFSESSDLIVLFLVLFTAGPFLNPFVGRYLTAIGKHGIFARLSPCSALLNLGLSLLLVQFYGIYGVAFASTVQAFIFVPMYLRVACKNLDISVFYYLLRSVLPAVLPAMILGSVAFLFRAYAGITSYYMLLLTVTVSSVSWLITFWILSLSSVERKFIWAKIFRKDEVSYPSFLPPE